MPDQPKVLIVGDSIAIGYTPLVAEGLAGRFAVRRNDGNASDSAHLLAHLPDYLAAEPGTRLVHFNCGLHDIKHPRGGGPRQVELEDYRRNLAEIISMLVYRVERVIWASSTPVIYARHHAAKEFDRLEEDVAIYNSAAADIVAAAGIPTDDLFAAVAAAGPPACIADDGVHMTERGNAVLAEAVAASIVRRLAREAP